MEKRLKKEGLVVERPLRTLQDEALALWYMHQPTHCVPTMYQGWVTQVPDPLDAQANKEDEEQV